MITSIVINNQCAGEPLNTGYSTIKEARQALAPAWPELVSEREHYTILADYSGDMLLLETLPATTDASSQGSLLSYKFDYQTVSGLNQIINAASGATANTFWMNTGLRPCEMIVQLAADLIRLRGENV